MTTASASELRFRVSGMHCAGCAATVQRAIEAGDGITSAAVSVANGMATVTGEPGVDLDPEALVRAIRNKGFDAEPVVDRPDLAAMRTDIEERQRRSARIWRVRATVGLAIWAPMMILHWTAPEAWGPWLPWVMLVGATSVLATAGAGFYASAWAAARRGTTNMDTLIAMGATTAWVYSTVMLVLHQLGRGLEHQLYFGEAAGLLAIVSLGHWLEARSSASAGSAIRELLHLQPDEAERLGDDNETTTIPTSDVRPGDRLLVRPGARLPVDGAVVEGDSDVDESVVTGESVPVAKHPGDEVVAGGLNTTGRLVIEASVDGRHTTIARIADLVQRAQSSKADIQRLADRVSSVFVPVVLTVALVTALGWWIAGDPVRGVIASVTVLVISCPCALGLATPMAVMVGAGEASRRGILVKTAGAFERAGRIHGVVFDKTGTLTAGEPRVTAVNTDGGFDDDALVRIAAAAEAPSEHPVARAIVREAARREIELPPVEDFTALPGQGVRGTVDGREVVIERSADAACRVVVDGAVAGTIEVADALREDAGTAIERLRAAGIEVTMLSGDRREVAERIGETLGLRGDAVIAEATPESKEQFIATCPPGTAMVGDGINDAAALAKSDLGIAMASGTNIAIESADVVIPGDRVTAVAETITVARDTLRTIRQNLFFAFFYNVLAIPAAAFGLLGTSGPLIAAAAMGLSDITVVGNALRLKRRLQRQRRA